MIDVEKLTITNVIQKWWNNDSIDITFTLNDFRYQLHIRKDQEGVFYPLTIFHISETSLCSHCNNEQTVCKGLKMYKEDLFYHLIQYPSIRLEWLYIPYAEV